MRLEGTAELQVLADRLREAGDKGLKRRVAKAVRDAAKPIGEATIRDGSEPLPRRHGLSGHISRGQVGIRAGLAGRVASVSILLKGDGYDLRPLDKSGDLRHPVFGNRKNWVSQRVKAGTFTAAFQRQAPLARRAVLGAANETLDDIGRGL